MVNFIYIGSTFLNCGPSGGQKSALGADASFRTRLTGAYATDFADAKHLFDELHTNMEQIVAKGSSQEGFSAEEKAARTSQNLNQTAAENKHVQQLIGEKAAVTGAVPGVESGVTQAVRASAATAAETAMNTRGAKITEENYEVGRENYNRAVAGELALPAATMNPATSAAGAVTGAEKVESEQANENAAASSSWMGLVGGLAGSLGSAGITAACVTPETLILLSDGTEVPAGDLSAGSHVSGFGGPEEIVLIEKSVQPCLEVSLANGMTIKISESHTFAAYGRGYIVAKDALEQSLLTTKGPIKVVKVEKIEDQVVVKLSLSGLHGYVSDNIWSLE